MNVPLKVPFHKYQATGNDFVLIDNRSGTYNFTNAEIRQICDRRFGVGADGLMLIEQHPTAHFRLQYYNSDGSQSLCGNGSRAAVQMANALGIVAGEAHFEAFDGLHEAIVNKDGEIRLKMADVHEVVRLEEDFFINTGSPHFVRFVDSVADYPVVEEGRRIRYADRFAPGGTNVNFVELREGNAIFVRTYERGVEDETLSCGTGVTAAALAASFRQLKSPVTVMTRGGELAVEFRETTPPSGKETSFTDIFLTGPAKRVFTGSLDL